VNLGLLHGAGHVHGAQRAGVVIAARPREGERHHGRLLPRRQEVEQREPHRFVLGGGAGGGGGEGEVIMRVWLHKATSPLYLREK